MKRKQAYCEGKFDHGNKINDICCKMRYFPLLFDEIFFAFTFDVTSIYIF